MIIEPVIVLCRIFIQLYTFADFFSSDMHENATQVAQNAATICKSPTCFLSATVPHPLGYFVYTFEITHRICIINGKSHSFFLISVAQLGIPQNLNPGPIAGHRRADNFADLFFITDSGLFVSDMQEGADTTNITLGFLVAAQVPVEQVSTP
jgi:hypothetical protein